MVWVFDPNHFFLNDLVKNMTGSAREQIGFGAQKKNSKKMDAPSKNLRFKTKNLAIAKKFDLGALSHNELDKQEESLARRALPQKEFDTQEEALARTKKK